VSDEQARSHLPVWWTGPDGVARALEESGYLSDQAIATAAFLAGRLGRPLLAEGPAGTGKTALAKALSDALGRRLVRLQCYEGLDESRALFEWDYRRQLLRIQLDAASARDGDPRARWTELAGELFSSEFLLERPLLEAIASEEPVVLLVDEVDRLDPETEALLLEVLGERQVTVPELGTLRARSEPLVVLTSNDTRELSDALRRRCLYLAMEHPSPERERAILLRHVPDLDAALAEEIVEVLGGLRHLELSRSPSVPEALDWARTLVELGVRTLDAEVLRVTLGVVVKQRSDLAVAAKELGLGVA
jgi:MoxR-like ATPase